MVLDFDVATIEEILAEDRDRIMELATSANTLVD